jgi:hypothetical protein
MVTIMRRLFSALVVACLAAVALVAAPAVASAASGGLHAIAPTCPAANYPPTPNATVMSSTTTPFIGQKLEVSGSAYCPDEDVRLTIGGTFVGTAHTDATGAFDPSAIVPGPVGQKQLCGVGASGLANDRDCLPLTISAGHGTDAVTTGGGLAMTGTQIAGLVVLAVALVAGGAFLAAAGRRRKTDALS